ncbi:hypothetical protein GW937_01865 [Candidatus Kaiserbacteria bacterium]|nr:hypothetical protein [Candidatus Kaiserbacteria bacterium]NCT02296.1 hypothetical protein [Candidatus Parcubacteria bacterium]
METILIEEGHPIALFDTYLSMIEGSVGSKQYLRLFIKTKEGVPCDVIENGRFACAYFASSILTLTGLCTRGVHTTVTETIADMQQSNWYQIDHLTKGAVIIWSPKLCSDGNQHQHIGFSIGDDMAVSTDGQTGIPTKHDVTYRTILGPPVREISKIFFHDTLR